MKFLEELDSVNIYEAGKPIELVVRDYGIESSKVIKLASNENPNGTPPSVIDKLKSEAKNAFRYPDDSMYELKSKLSQKFSLKDSNIIIGAGSDQIIEMIIRSKCRRDSKILTSKTTFAMYSIYASTVGAKVVKTKSHEHIFEEFKEEMEREFFDIIFLCLPNNPLGECMDRDDVYKILELASKETLVVLDGAYQEYAKRKDSKKSLNPNEIVERFDNAIYLGTFSKAYGLGGLRVGYGFSNEEIIRTLTKLRSPFNITTLSLCAAIEAMSCDEFVDSSIDSSYLEMKRYESFAKEHSIEHIESYTNFITYLFDDIDSSDFSQWLLERGVIIRNLKSYGLNGVRITIGKSLENSIFFDKAREYLAQRGR